MNDAAKLKPNTGLIVSAALMVVTLAAVAIVLEGQVLDLRTFRLIQAVVMTWAALQQLIFFVRIRNPRFVIPLLLFVDFALANYADWFRANTLRDVLAVLFFPLLIASLFLLFKNGFMFQSRKILELAARSVKGAEDGYTHRPFPAGEVSAGREEIIAFAKYLRRQLIAYSHISGDRVYLAISDNSWRYVFNLLPRPGKATYASFEHNGRISVHMAEKDYRKYREEITFDELCASLGDVFKRFLDFHRNDEGEKILAELQAVGA